MKHIYDAFAYSDAPRAQCWWDQTCDIPVRPALEQDETCDVAIIGGGFTGISAALHLAEAGVKAVVLENRYVGWGASGRNGGFCCLGGGRLGDAALDRKFGREDRLAYRATEMAAITLVDALTKRFDIDVDRHSNGETELAHRPRDMDDLRARVAQIKENYGLDATLIEKKDLEAHGLKGPFHGGLTIPAGFGLNPRKYITGLAAAAEAAGARIYHDTAAQQINRRGDSYEIRTQGGILRADKVIVATNGYSSEDLPEWLAGRYMPAQSSVIVTRPLSIQELATAGWTSDQMVYDTRNLLHYFRLMPDRRMLFGMRGGLMTGPTAEGRALDRVRRDFEAMFPAWSGVETPYAWSGMVCIARDQMPFVGGIPGHNNLFATLCYHGNGVAMGSYSGAMIANVVMGKTFDGPYPKSMQRPLKKFEFGSLRRAVMPLAYLGFALADR
ncbi:NAD(P)/FAD-dependent oxidoreductase [Roseobacter sp. GAI101]|uniref:NAD(P)/FAD-dependent oxidoreductase n=1 Tax=Roseobacter sp. (strain GAI101) TaxID=391589 RepID=UPI00018725CC|nr:FAD-dependent oxidoreductase [Roseobacter sp. GAI101]EEB83840.1 FAD dependent oxidoreductase [Roseobacter sp. GAI101]